MSFVITAGGTGGHVSPALAVAAELQKLGKHVVFAGSTGGMEERLAREAGLEYQAFSARGFNRQRPWTLLSSGAVLARSTGRACRWLCEVQARVVGAFGGYVSVPVGRAAVREGVPLLIHEQNSHMGWANRHLSKHADVIALTYEAAADALDASARERVELTGNPVRPEFAALADAKHTTRLRHNFRQELGIEHGDLVLLVFGGSQGARHINRAVVRHATALLQRPALTVLHLTGPKEYQSVAAALAQEFGGSIPQAWQLMDYCDRMPEAFAAADLVLCRAGASSLAEVSAAGRPALLVPYPYATADHQRKNAESLVAAGAAQRVLDAELDGPRFSEVLFTLLDNAETRARMLTAAAELSEAGAARRVAELLVGIAR
ncbi:MAG: undecaprenyldiphospho-muramoylpentapeptide beta-N-acetylglucosaminyltransferase [Coriobacteriales bacterium]|jgi:UDP-N-acetylglucosamine--N-acetylmuramyl-(pentapeptide) pyrophosphoryl-undecaprenol N-acetylglucosamine transferase|nr:undecaprenyldiphospho-muramoylpentapeptide beta-N-acetylglucosaminyltransferase [Coriobacteriales bacterium]